MDDKNDASAEENGQAATHDQLPVDGKVSWFFCACLSLANFVCVGSCYIYGIFFPVILEEFRAGKAITALPGSFAVGFICLLSPMCSFFVKRFGARVTLLCGGATCAVGFLATSFAINIYLVCLTYGFVVAWGSCLIYMAGFLTVPLYFDKHRSLATGIVSGGPGAGFILMSPISQSLVEHFGWRKAMMSLGGINLIVCLLGFGITRKVKSRSVGPSSGCCCKRLKKILCGTLSSMKASVFNTPLLALVLVMTFFVGMAQHLPLVHLIKYADEIGIPSHKSSWMYPIKGIVSIIFRIITGKIGDTGRISFYHIFQFGTGIMALNNVLMPISRKLGHLYTYAAILGICEAMYFTSLYCLAMTLHPKHGIGLLFLVATIPSFSSPAIAGLIADLGDSYIPVFYIAGSVFVLITLITFLRHCVPRQPSIEVPLNAASNGMDVETQL